MKKTYLDPSVMQIRQDKNYFISQYFVDFALPSYSGTLETFTGNCPNPSGSQPFSITFQPDPSDPHSGFLFLPGQQDGFFITILDDEGHFEAHLDIPTPSPFGDECIAQPQTADISGQVTPQSLTFTIDHAFINMTDNPNDQQTCQLLGQTCHVPGEFNGTSS